MDAHAEIVALAVALLTLLVRELQHRARERTLEARAGAQFDGRDSGSYTLPVTLAQHEALAQRHAELADRLTSHERDCARRYETLRVQGERTLETVARLDERSRS